MSLEKTRNKAYMQKHLITILLCLSIFFVPICGLTTVAVTPGESGTQTNDVGTEQKEGEESCKETSEKDTNPQTDAKKSGKSVEPLPTPQISDEKKRVISEKTPETNKGTEHTIPVSKSDIINVEVKSEQGVSDSVDKSEPVKDPVGQASNEKPPASQENILKVHFIDVDQGDSALIHDNKYSILVGGGESRYGEYILSYLKEFGISEINLVIVTHPHDDHIGGLIAVLKKIPVKKVLLPDVDYFTNQYDKLTEVIQSNKIKVEFPSTGYEFKMLNSTATMFTPRQTFKNVNNNSIVMRLVHGNNSFLFMGDAEYDEELDLMQQNVDLKSNVLKVGHHCSNTSSSEAMLKYISPSKAVISVGAENVYGHPDKDTLIRIHKICPEVYRTDKCGTISFTSDGKTLSSDRIPCNYEEPSRVLPGFKFIGNLHTKKFHRATCKFVPAKAKAK